MGLVHQLCLRIHFNNSGNMFGPYVLCLLQAPGTHQGIKLTRFLSLCS